MKLHLTRTGSRGTLLVLLLALAGCSALGLDGRTSEAARLRHNKAKWADQGISAYRFSYDVSCFCPRTGPIAVEVQGAAVVRATYEESNEPLSPYAQQHLPTVESLFAIAEQAIAGKADLLEVDYHPVLGYPTRIAIDRAFNAADDEVVHYASALVAIPPD